MYTVRLNIPCFANQNEERQNKILDSFEDGAEVFSSKSALRLLESSLVNQTEIFAVLAPMIDLKEAWLATIRTVIIMFASPLFHWNRQSRPKISHWSWDVSMWNFNQVVV